MCWYWRTGHGRQWQLSCPPIPFPIPIHSFAVSPQGGLCLVTAWNLLEICSRPSGLRLRLGVDSLRVECEGFILFFTIVVLATAVVASPMSCGTGRPAPILGTLSPTQKPSRNISIYASYIFQSLALTFGLDSIVNSAQTNCKSRWQSRRLTCCRAPRGILGIRLCCSNTALEQGWSMMSRACHPNFWNHLASCAQSDFERNRL